MTRSATLPAHVSHASANPMTHLLQQASAQVRTLRERELAVFGMNGKHYAILAAVLERGPMTQQGLCRLLHIDRTTMVKLVDDLERLGVAFRDVHPQDRRAFEVDVSPEGDLVFQQASAALAQAEQQYFGALSGEERRLLQQVLQRLVER